MALWAIITPKKPGEFQWDDGDKLRPGEAGFSDAKVSAYAGAKNYNYIGTPNWVAPQPPADPAP